MKYDRNITLRELIAKLESNEDLLDKEITSVGWYNKNWDDGYVFYFGHYGDKDYREIRIQRRTSKHHVGEIVTYHGHECVVTAVWNDDGETGVTIEPTGGYGFPIDVYDHKLQ